MVTTLIRKFILNIFRALTFVLLLLKLFRLRIQFVFWLFWSFFWYQSLLCLRLLVLIVATRVLFSECLLK